MRRGALLGLIMATALAVGGLGAWLLVRGTGSGLWLVVLGVLGFVVAFASAMPQSTSHARDE